MHLSSRATVVVFCGTSTLGADKRTGVLSTVVQFKITRKGACVTERGAELTSLYTYIEVSEILFANSMLTVLSMLHICILSCREFVQQAACSSLGRADMGWWGYLLFSPGEFFATTPQECEYMASRAVGWGASPAFETEVRCLH